MFKRPKRRDRIYPFSELSLRDALCPQCGKLRKPRGIPHGLGVAGLSPVQRGCFCDTCGCAQCGCPTGTCPDILVRISDITACTGCGATANGDQPPPSAVSVISSNIPNGDHFIVGGTPIGFSVCKYSLFKDVDCESWVDPCASASCDGAHIVIQQTDTEGCTGTVLSTKYYRTFVDIDLNLETCSLTFAWSSYRCHEGNSGGPWSGVTFFDTDPGPNTSQKPYCIGDVIPNDFPCWQDTNVVLGKGGSVQVLVDGAGDCRCCECVHCKDCGVNKPGCPNSSRCSPSVIRLTTSSVSDCLGLCFFDSTNKQVYRLDGTTDVNTTIDIYHNSSSCTWSNTLFVDHSFKKLQKTPLPDLTYRATKINNTNWRLQVFATDGTTTVHLFDATVSSLSGNCLTGQTGNNSLACDICASPRVGGENGTFQITPQGVGGTSCGSCTTTPTSISATTANISTCTGTCETCGLLDGTTAVNRSITLNQVGGSPCVFEATVSSDYILFDDSVFTIDEHLVVVYELKRTAAGTWSEEIYGKDRNGVKRVSYAGATSGSCALNPDTFSAAANNCKTIATHAWPSRTCCADGSLDKIIAGSGGSTSHTVCP